MDGGARLKRAKTSADPSRSTKEDWLNHAIRTLVTDGIDHVKIQVIARELGVSRSSFYWFFDSLEDLHNQLLEHWLKKNTGPIIERAMRPAPTIIRAIINVFECWTDEELYDPRLDMAVRLWARRSERVKAVVQFADSQRLEAVAAMYRRYGYEEEDALIRARVLYFTQIGHYTLEVDEDLETRHFHVRAYLRSFSGMEPTEEDIEISRRMTFHNPPPET
jgi:AcrR family transcriptional regulator